jgi:hypothetical protein
MNDDAGVVSLEAVWILPLFMLLGLGLLHTLGYARDVLVVHEAARAGVRHAAVTDGVAGPVAAAREAAFGHDVTVTVSPPSRAFGDTVTVEVTVQRHIGPVRYPVSARAYARVEPVVSRWSG